MVSVHMLTVVSSHLYIMFYARFVKQLSFLKIQKISDAVYSLLAEAGQPLI